MVLRAFACAVTAALVAAPVSVVAPAEATFPGDNGFIVYVRDSSSGRDIYRIRADGSQRKRLTTMGKVQDPRFDATGRWIAFTHVGAGSKDVWVMRADGSGQRALITGAAEQSEPTWSPDGRWLAYTSDESGRRQVHLYERATGTSTQLTFPTAQLTASWSPAWSPGGRRIAYVARAPIDDPEGGPLGETYWAVLMTVRPDGTNPRQLTSSYYVNDPDWTPGAARIVFAYNDQGGHDLCYLHAHSIASNGSESRPIRSSTFGCFEHDPVRSPTNRHMVLWSTGRDYFSENPRTGLYRARANGMGQRLIDPGARAGLGIDWQAR